MRETGGEGRRRIWGERGGGGKGGEECLWEVWELKSVPPPPFVANEVVRTVL